MQLTSSKLASLFIGAFLATIVSAADSNGKLVPASDHHISYTGRFDEHDSKHVVAIWQSTRISTDFKSQHLAIEFGPSVDQSYFDADVDGASEIVAVQPGREHQTYVWPHPLDGAAHHFTLTKRSEAAAGYATFDGLTLDRDGKVSTPATHHDRLRFIFFGDSITAGACNEDGALDQWESRHTHNANKSYAAFTANAFGADFQNISISGMGIITGYVPVRAGEVWDRIYPKADSARADVGKWQPNVVFVNYGENDTSYTHGHGQPFPPTFSAGYVTFVESLRRAYPTAEIVLLRGGMGGGAQDANLRAAWTTAVEQLEKMDSRVAHFVFTHFTTQHPRVADDQAMADELSAWLKPQPFVAVTKTLSRSAKSSSAGPPTQ